MVYAFFFYEDTNNTLRQCAVILYGSSASSVICACKIPCSRLPSCPPDCLVVFPVVTYLVVHLTVYTLSYCMGEGNDNV